MRTAFVEIPTFLFESAAFSVEDALKNQLYHGGESNGDINNKHQHNILCSWYALQF